MGEQGPHDEAAHAVGDEGDPVDSLQTGDQTGQVIGMVGDALAAAGVVHGNGSEAVDPESLGEVVEHSRRAPQAVNQKDEVVAGRGHVLRLLMFGIRG